MMTKFKDLITSVDMLNTLHGGLSEPVLSILDSSVGREIHIRVPGVKKEALQVEIVNNQLSIYYLIPMYSAGKLMHMPQIVYMQAIPYFIEASKIEATFEDNELVVRLPFNELSNGYNRKIKIDG
ncbi:MAG: Hsp20/alpha crystallin family protein [Bacteroidota bacterium]